MNKDVQGAIRALAENGSHFLRSTLEEVEKLPDGAEGSRNAVIFMAAALEVLLKARLAAEHWTLVFDDPATAKISSLSSGDFHSVGAKQLVARLNNTALPKLPKDVPEKIFSLRNSVVHFAPPSNFAVRVEIAAGLNYILNHVNKEIEPLLADESRPAHQDLTGRITAVFISLNDFREKRLKTLEGVLSTCALLVQCPECSQPTLRLEQEKQAECLFCLSKFDAEVLVNEYMRSFLWGSHEDFEWYGLGDCLECSDETLVFGVTVVRRPKIAYLCFSCTKAYGQDEITKCARCGGWMLVDDEMTACSECYLAALGETD